jgi:serine protease inhibitor ecotin
MSNEEYKRILRATQGYSYAMSFVNGFDNPVSNIMKLPHPQREEAFVRWSIMNDKNLGMYNLKGLKNNDFEINA